MAKASGDNGEMAGRLVPQPAGTAKLKPEDTIRYYLTKMQSEIKAALPSQGCTVERFTRVVLTAVRTTPKLLECDPISLLAAVMQAAQLGLEPGGALGHCYFVPYAGKVQFQLGYRGMIELARRSGNIQSICAQVVHENDLFEYEYGLHENLRHVPAKGERGKPTHYYAYAMLKDGGHQFEVMTAGDVEKIRQRSKAKDSGPWITDYEEMGRKTPTRKLFKYLPVRVEIQIMVAQDGTAKSEIAPDMTLVPDAIDGEFTVLPTEDPAIPAAPETAADTLSEAERNRLADMQAVAERQAQAKANAAEPKEQVSF